MKTKQTATKQTAANNEFLKNVKRDWNSKIYKKASEIINEQGEQAARQFVQQFTTKSLGY